MELKERLDLFKAELSLIARADVRDFTKAVIGKAPDYVFWDCPSSSSGKYHPIDELSGDGTILHERKVFAVAYELSRGLDCEYNRDLVLSAVLLHDLVKQGFESTGHTVRNHPQLAAQLIADVYNSDFKDKLDKEAANIIYWSVFHHYGPWTLESVKKPLREYTQEELCMYMSDYIASKRFIKVDFLRRDGLGFIELSREDGR